MQPIEEIELQLWDYIDNRCSEAMRARITTLIAEDATWKKLYEEIQEANALFATTAPEHTSMRFTKNVMEAVGQSSIAPRSAQYLNQFLIKGIAGFMVTCIAVLLVYIIATSNWSQIQPATKSRIDFDWMMSPMVLQVAGFLFVILTLALIDALLRKNAVADKKFPL